MPLDSRYVEGSRKSARYAVVKMETCRIDQLNTADSQ